MKPSKRAYHQHEALKQTILANPHMIGLEAILNYQEEVEYYNSRRLPGKVDLMLWDGQARRYIIEVTTSTSPWGRLRLQKQARRAKRYFQDSTVITVQQQQGGLEVTWY